MHYHQVKDIEIKYLRKKITRIKEIPVPECPPQEHFHPAGQHSCTPAGYKKYHYWRIKMLMFENLIYAGHYKYSQPKQPRSYQCRIWNAENGRENYMKVNAQHVKRLIQKLQPTREVNWHKSAANNPRKNPYLTCDSRRWRQERNTTNIDASIRLPS